MELKKNFQSAFTLIELIVTVAIIGILLSVVVPSYQSQILKSKFEEALVMLNIVIDAQERYRIEHGHYLYSENNIYNERYIQNQLKVDFSQFPNFALRLEHTSSDQQYKARVFIRPDDFGICSDEVVTNKCKENNTSLMETFFKTYNRSEDNHYVEAFKEGITDDVVIDDDMHIYLGN
jgi:prepilin-type N-terminal cleavage/methylation domain-containing protein